MANKLIRAKKETAQFSSSIVNVIKQLLKKHYQVVSVQAVEDNLIEINVKGRGGMAFVTSDFVTDMFKLQKRITQKVPNFSYSAVPINVNTLNFVFKS